MATWIFETGNPPIITNISPAADSYQRPDFQFSFDILDQDSYIRGNSIRVLVNGDVAFDGYDFIYPYNGPDAYMGRTIVDGYEGYHVIIDAYGFYYMQVSVYAQGDDYGFNEVSQTWEYGIDTGPSPIITNISPTPSSSNQENDFQFSFDILDTDKYVLRNSILISVNGDVAFDGYDFIYPYNAPDSYMGRTIVDGYEGYHVIIDAYGQYPTRVVVSAHGNDYYFNPVTQTWEYGVKDYINMLYYCDGYGLKAIDLRYLVGESQDATRLVLDAYTAPALPSNNITFIHGMKIDGYYYLALSMDGYIDEVAWGYPSTTWGSFFYGAGPAGVKILKNELYDHDYRDGYRLDKAQFTENGILYVINLDLNQIEAYYGAYFRDGYGRKPDYVYNTTSTPPIFPGYILDLHVVSGKSSIYNGGTRLYVGTTEGMSRIETYDKQTTIGYSDGMDSYGISFSYGIPGSGADFEVIGGAAPQVVEVSSDDDKYIILVGTDDGYGNGGLTQISLTGNKRIIFMNEEMGFIPNNHIRDIFGKDV